MAFPLIPLVAGAAIGSVVTYILKDKGVQDAIRLRGEQLKEEIMKRTQQAAAQAEAAAGAAAGAAAAEATETEEEAASPEAEAEGEEQARRSEEEHREEAQPVTH